MNQIFEISLNEKHNKQSLVKIQLRGKCILIASSKPMDRPCSTRTELTCGAEWSDIIVAIKKAMQDVTKKTKNYEDAAFRNNMQ